jgi:hypothetical protein
LGRAVVTVSTRLPVAGSADAAAEAAEDTEAEAAEAVAAAEVAVSTGCCASGSLAAHACTLAQSSSSKPV